MINNVYAYCRVSHIDSAESGYGIDAQIAAARAKWRYLQETGKAEGLRWGQTGWKGTKQKAEMPIPGFFIDKAVSAYKSRLRDRPAGRLLCNVVMPGDLILIPKMDRSFRSVGDWHDQTRYWLERNIGVIFCDVDIDMRTPQGRMMAGMLAIVAEFSSALQSERLKEVAARSREIGRKVNQHMPLGWKKGPRGMLIPDDEVRAAVKRITELREIDPETGKPKMSYGKIAVMLETERAQSEGRAEPWPQPPHKDSDKCFWTADRVRTLHRRRDRVAPTTDELIKSRNQRLAKREERRRWRANVRRRQAEAESQEAEIDSPSVL